MKQFGKIIAGVHYIKRPTVSALILSKDRRIVAVEFMGKYFLPGGGIEYNETPHEALHRELKEELGWKIKIVKEICRAEEYLYATLDKKHFNKQGIFYMADKTERIAPSEICEHQPLWLTFEEFKSKAAHESHVWAYSQIL